MTATKEHIVEAIYNEVGYSKSESTKLVESLLEIIKKTLANGDDVLVSGFGKFCVREKKERTGRNPATREDLRLKQRKVVTFTCSQVLRDKINGK
jgi:integration host factor subunit alpha